MGTDQQLATTPISPPPNHRVGRGLLGKKFKHLYAVEKFQDHRRLLHLTGPAVIIAGYGMCTGGRIVNHLKHGLSDPKNDLFFVGYQACCGGVMAGSGLIS